MPDQYTPLPFIPFLQVELTCPECRTVFLAAKAHAAKRRYCSLRCKHTAFSRTMRRPLQARFWPKVDKRPGDTACWIWTGSRDARGYGTINPGGRGASPLRAPRVALAWALGRPILDGMSALHRCDHPPCVRNDGPRSHLYEGTPADNARDMAMKGRGTVGRPSPVSGDRHVFAKLTDDAVRDIRARHAEGAISISALAREYGVSRATLRSVLNSTTWRHV
jgi:hypothetical protein